MTKRVLTAAERAARDYQDRFEAQFSARRMLEIIRASRSEAERATLQAEVDAIEAYWGKPRR